MFYIARITTLCRFYVYPVCLQCSVCTISHALQVLRVLRVVRLVKLVRLLRASRILKRWEVRPFASSMPPLAVFNSVLAQLLLLCSQMAGERADQLLVAFSGDGYPERLRRGALDRVRMGVAGAAS